MRIPIRHARRAALSPRSAALFLAALAAATASAARGADPFPIAAGERVGLYPLSLPAGQDGIARRLAEQLHDGAAALPRVRAFDLIAKGSCSPDEGRCLAAAARSAGLDEMISVHVDGTTRGYRWVLRSFAASAGGVLRAEERGEVQGGPLDLAGGLEQGVCRVLGAAPCVGALAISSAEALRGEHLFVDGSDQGALPLAQPLSIPVGRHAVRLGKGEQRVRISYARESRLAAELRAGQPSLSEPGALPGQRPDSDTVSTSFVSANPISTPASSTPASSTPAAPAPLTFLAPVPLAGDRDPSPQARAQAARFLLASGAALLAAGGGIGLYARLGARSLDARYRDGTLTDADASRYGGVRTAGVTATILAAAGAGAIACGGLMIALTPQGAALRGSF